MSRIYKKNDWWRIEKASASLQEKTPIIFALVKQKYPTLTMSSSYCDATIEIKGICIYLRVRPCSDETRACLRFSVEARDLRRKTTRACDDDSGEVKETHRYSDGSSRIDLDLAFELIDGIVAKRVNVADELKKQKFKAEIAQMQLIGKINMILSDAYTARAYSNDTRFSIIYKVGTTISDERNVCYIEKRNENEFNIQPTGLGRIIVSAEQFEQSLRDFEHVFKYL